jgi:AcrR family transcriptional regulator
MTDNTTRTRQRVASRQRRDAILDEALRVIGEHGYQGFTLQELADRCGLTKPGLLHHFGSKDQLLIDLLRERDAKHEAAVVEVLGRHHDPAASPDDQRQMFIAALCLIMARNAAQTELLRLQVMLRVEAINPGHPAHDYFAGSEAAKLILLAEHVERFSLAPESTARQVLALANGLEEQWLRANQGFDLAQEYGLAIESLMLNRCSQVTDDAPSDEGARQRVASIGSV